MAPRPVMSAVEFWSSIEYSSFQQALVRELSASGWDARHRFELPQQRYWSARSRAERLLMRARCYGLYPATLAYRFAHGTPGLVGVVCSNTFFAPVIAELASFRRTPIVHWVFDLFPDVLVLAGKLGAGSVGERLARRCVREIFDRAVTNVFLGERLLAYAESRFGAIPRSVVIPVGCDARPFRNSPPTPRQGPLRVLYCGNLGRMHEVETIIEMLKAGIPDGVEVTFRGNGAGFLAIEGALREHTVSGCIRLGGNLPETEWVEAMREADVAIVSMKPGAEGVVMPSKTYSALAAGQAVLAIAPQKSDLADTIRKHDCGWVVEPGDAPGALAALVTAAREPDELLRLRTNAWRAGQEVFDQRVLAGAWLDVLHSALESA